jgi:crotonobetainyl-CoA:carnitine CoA-transferase CaiB-like acyl-CoA transferase
MLDSMRAALPLAGIRIISMALNAPGPLAVARLVDEGARVTKVEPPSGDPLAAICGSWYDELHRDLTVERLDLKSDVGRARMNALLADAGVFISSQRPSALARLGLDASSLAHVRWLNIVGERGHAEVPGHDLTYQARAGLLREALPVSLFADIMGSERAFSAVLLLLREPPGAQAEVGLYDSLAPLVATCRHGLTSPGGPLGGGLPAYGVYRAREGSVAIAALERHFRTRLYASLNLRDGSDLSAVMTTRTAAEWEEWAAQRDLPIAAIRDVNAYAAPARKHERPRNRESDASTT